MKHKENIEDTETVVLKDFDLETFKDRFEVDLFEKELRKKMGYKQDLKAVKMIKEVFKETGEASLSVRKVKSGYAFFTLNENFAFEYFTALSEMKGKLDLVLFVVGPSVFKMLMLFRLAKSGAGILRKEWRALST